LGKIGAYEINKHNTPLDGSSYNKKKDLALKASQENKGKSKVKNVIESSSNDESGDAKIVFMVRNTTKMLKSLSKKEIKFHPKKKFFTSSKKKQIKQMNCYTCGKLGRLAH
jgi:hypothetical protein